MSKISVTTVAGLTSGANANKVIVESGDSLEIPSGNLTVSNGTSTLNGNVTSNGTITGAEVSNGNYMIDQWRLTSNSTGNGVVNANWARFDFNQSSNSGVNNGGQIGTQMQEASGVFTFPRTGVYLVTLDANFKLLPTEAPLSEHVYIAFTTNNSTFVDYAICQMGMTSTSVNSNVITDINASCRTLVNVTDTSNCKVNFKKDGFETSTALRGEATYARTQVFFERKGPAQ